MKHLNLKRQKGDERCHNWGAPFEKTVLDEEKNYKDGYQSGLELGLKGRFYQAGGPYVTGQFEVNRPKKCKHWEEMVRFEEKNCAAFKRGWRDGQAAAKRHPDEQAIWEWVPA